MLNDYQTGGFAGQSWTVRSLESWGTAALARQGFDEAHLHIELMLAHALSLPRVQLSLQRDRSMTSVEVEAFLCLYIRRQTHEPLQYVLGKTEFMGLSFDVDRRVLIPRPETEVLVEQTLDLLRSSRTPTPRILDIGTGSGCIAIALGYFVPDCSIVALDISEHALEVARRNVARYGLKNIAFEMGDIFSNVLPGERFDYIVANPPYIAREEYQTLEPEVRDFEPRCATTDEEDGFRFIRRITAFSRDRLKGSGTLLMEIGYGQVGRATSMVTDSGFREVNVVNDYAGLPRVIVARAEPHLGHG